MDQRQISILLAAVEQQWRDLPPEQRPKGVWIRRHDPLPPDAVDRMPTPVRAVWFLDERGLRKGDVRSFLRFYTVHIVQPWCARAVPEKNQIFGRVHAIGLAAFASYRGSDEVYLETIWGNLHGRGGRYSLDEHGALKLVGPEWIS
jgi:hypothetical protein